ncbi:hypothetical protein [Chelatococcus asaccharovorans]|uniref:hypothetical protein n=1 Tax=Chelatococcus asaccharovorans TaxID=28210 RepID=UPI00224C7AA8|nr:hypothetical protein [Chelatococcus asaccharovorans]CAH1674052.1 hypothetical protein CHELA40_13941 [Chelatococcus asaccharovorans]CAH1674570.1 hypothetical protein CHELA17_61687 [Chelatococcus asaccharovorans]
MFHIPDHNWSPQWQKDERYGKRITEGYILQAAKKHPFIATALRDGTLIVNAGPHVKAGPDGGGDARPHVSIRIEGEAHHLILTRNPSKNRYEFFELGRLSPETDFLERWAVERRRAAQNPGLQNPGQIDPGPEDRAPIARER